MAELAVPVVPHDNLLVAVLNVIADDLETDF